MRFLSRFYRVISPVVIFSMVVGSATPVIAAPAPTSPLSLAVSDSAKKESQTDLSLPSLVAEAANALSPSAFASQPALVSEVGWPVGGSNPVSRRQAQPSTFPSLSFSSFARWPSLNSMIPADTAEAGEPPSQRRYSGARRAAPTEVGADTAADTSFTVYLPLVIISDPNVSTGTITPETGGMLASPDGRVHLEIPTGAVASDTTVQFRQLPRQGVPHYQSTGPFFELTAWDAQGNPISQFQRDFSLTIGYTEALNVVEDRLALYYLDNIGWQPVASTVYANTNQVVATLNHFTEFALLAPSTHNWILGENVDLCDGTEIRHGPNLGVHTVVPVNDWTVRVRDVPGNPRIVNGEVWWDTSRFEAGDPSGGTGWVSETQADEACLDGSNIWMEGEIVYLCEGAEIRHGPGLGFGVHTIVPEDNWPVEIISQPIVADEQTWWDTSRADGGTGWVSQQQAEDSCFGLLPLSPEQRALRYKLGPRIVSPPLGDPVDACTGNHLQQFTDWGVPGVGGFGFILQRTFNGLALQDGSFGFGWSSWLDASLRLARDGSADVTYPDGHSAFFVAEGDAYAPGQEGVFDTLTYEGDTFVLTTPEQMSYRFNGQGRLTAMSDRHGNVITLERDADGHVTTLTDSAGREFTLTYEDTRITSIQDELERAVSYNYENGDLVSVTDPNGGTYEFEYDAHRLITLTDPENILYLQNDYDGEGRVVEQIDASGTHSFFTYTDDEITFTDNLSHQTITRCDDLDRATEIEDHLGQKENFVYDADYNVTDYTDKRGHTWTFTHDAQGNLLTATDPLLHTVTYTYNSTNDLTSLTDLGGPGDTSRTTTFVYDSDGNLTDILRPDITTIHATYDSHGQMLTLTDGNGHTTHYTYDAQGNLTDVVDPEGNLTHYGYDAIGRQTSMTDANGHTVGFQYDGNDNLTKITDPKGRFITFEYDRNDNLKKMTDRRGGITEYGYDENLKLISEKDPEGHLTAYDYDLMYNRTVMTDAVGNVTLYRYDELYRLKEVEDALHGITHFDYDPNGNVTSVTDALTQITTFEYDELNRLKTQIDALLGVTTFEYDVVSRLTRMVNPRLAPTEYEYDLLDRLALARDALSGEWELGYDAAGNVIRLTDANDRTTTLHYDDADRLIEQIDPEGHRTDFGYDGVGNVLLVTDALGRPTHYTYDANDNLETITDALNGLTTLAYDEEDNLTALTDARNNITRFAYDLDGLLTDQTEAGGQLTTFDYDPTHNLTTYTNAKINTWHYTYDELNRRVTETDPLTHLTTYGYDALSRLTLVTDANNITTRYAFDALDRLTDVIQNDLPGGLFDYQTNVTTHYDYDPVGNLIGITDANGETTTFEYDLLDRLTKETNPLGRIWRYEYDPVGNLTTRTDAKGQATRYFYDADDLLTRLLYPDSTDITFGYDAVHNQTSMTGSLGATINEYDALNRLMASTNHLNQTVEYGYDAVGNRTSLTYPDERLMRYEYDSTNFTSRVIDPDGNVFNVTRDATHNITRIDYPNQTHVEYDIDAAERLMAVRNLQNDGGVISTFAYTLDAVGNRTHVDGTYAWRNPPDLNFDYTYDPLYRLTRSNDSEGHFTEYAYDAVGNRTRLTTNDDPTLTRAIDTVTTEYTYDAANELVTSIRDLLPRGNVGREQQTAQILSAFAHEVEAQDGQHIESATAADLLGQANSLIADLEGNPPPGQSEVEAALTALRTDVELAGKEGNIDNAGVVNSLLVKLDHASDANAQTGGEVMTTLYDYDLNGNRIRRTMPDEGTGNENDRLKTEYTYEFENRLVNEQDFRDPNNGNWLEGDETQLTYDGYGRLFRRLHDQHIGGGGDQKWVDYVYDGLDPIAEYENPSPQYHNYYRGLGRILNMRQNAGGGEGDGLVYYFHHDGLGSVSAMTKHDGQSAHTYRYHDYGIILDVNGKAADASNFTNPHNHYAYTGQLWDENMELFHFYAREYEPETGVWLQQDPYRGRLDMPGTLQRYGYVYNNPANYVDIYGFSTRKTGSSGCGSIMSCKPQVGCGYTTSCVLPQYTGCDYTMCCQPSVSSPTPTMTPSPSSTPAPTPSPSICTMELLPRDLGGGNLLDREYVLEASVSQIPPNSNIYYQGTQMNLTGHGIFDGHLRWGISTGWAYMNPGWDTASRWELRYPCPPR